MLPVWIYVIVLGVAANAYAFVKLYKTASLAGRARRVRGGQPGAAVPLRPAELDLGLALAAGGTASGAGCSPP